ncbi:MAG: hypothetical protein RKU31_13570 [Deltaproteobacteria bacterium]
MARADVPERVLAIYERLIASAGVERKGGKVPYTSMNGNMFSFITQEGAIAIRLGDADREAFMAKHGTGPVIQYGAVMRGYVEVPDALLTKTTVLRRAFAKSVAHAATLKAKPTTKPKPGAKKSAAKKPGAKISAAKKPGAKKSAAKKPAAKKSAAKKPGAKRSAR